MTHRTLNLVVVSVWLSSAAVVFGQQPADLVLTNGKIVTVDDRFTIAQAVAVRGDRIVAVGANAEVSRLAGATTRRIDLGGRTVTPGLIDNHMHLLRGATTWMRELRFDGVESRKKAIDLIQARAKAEGPGAWVFNIGGWAHQQFADDPKPFTREELDRIAPDNPVALQESYYQVFLNSKGLHEFGIEANAPDPKDFVTGSIMRDASGKPTGVIKGDIAATRPVAARSGTAAPTSCGDIPRDARRCRTVDASGRTRPAPAPRPPTATPRTAHRVARGRDAPGGRGPRS